MSYKFPKSLRFECIRCTLCCSDTEDRTRSILLLNSEANRISRKTLMAIDRFANRIEGFEPYIYTMRKTENRQCIFLSGDSCTIYLTRPLICRFYPFELKNVGNDRYVFISTDECPGIGKGSKLEAAFFQKLFDKFIKLMKENAKSIRKE